MNAKKQLKKALKEISAFKNEMAETKSETTEHLVTSVTLQELEELYQMCEDFTLFQAVIESQGLSEPENILDPNLQLSCEHFAQHFRRRLWDFYYALEDRQDEAKWDFEESLEDDE